MFAWIRKYWPEAALAAVLIAAGVWELPARPATWFDEGINVGIAKALVEHGAYSFEIAPGGFIEERPFLITTNYPVLLPVALSLKLFGFTLASARAPAVLFLIGFVAAAYILVRRLYGRAAALWSVALLISFMPLYGNGKAVLGEVPGLFFLLVGLLALPLSGTDVRRFILAGVLFGLAVATKPFFFIVFVALAAGEFFAHRHSDVLAKRLGMLGIGVVLPLAGWFYSILPEPSVAGIADTVLYYTNSYASPDFFSLMGHNLVRFLTESTPLHFLLLSLAVAFSVFLRRRRGEPFSEMEVVLGVFVILTIMVYLKTPGWYRYFFPAHLVLFLAVPAALMQLASREAASFFLAGLFFVQAAHLASAWNAPLYYSRAAEETAERIMAETAPGASVLLVNRPSVALFLRDRAVYHYLEINPVLQFGKKEPAALDGTPITHIYD